MLRFHQVDVFSDRIGDGNALAVVHDADALTPEDMQRFARWTNLSETTFLLSPTTPDADYRVRIFTPGGELPFAGHPTLGSARAWIENGGAPRSADGIVQECGIGLISVRQDGTHYAFDAPPLRRDGAVDGPTRHQVVAALGLDHSEVAVSEWIDNGPGWIGVILADADAVLALEPDFDALGDLAVGVLGRYPAGGPADFETRAFVPSLGVPEDPVTGSLAAGFARWLVPEGLAPRAYAVRQGSRIGRNGLIRVHAEGDRIWVGGNTVVGVAGSVALP